MFYWLGDEQVFIDDNKYFDTVQVETSNNPEPWIQHINYNQKNTSKIFDEYNSEMETASFIIIKNDSILTEKYYNGYDENSVINSFSISVSWIWITIYIFLPHSLLIQHLPDYTYLQQYFTTRVDLYILFLN